MINTILLTRSEEQNANFKTRLKAYLETADKLDEAEILSKPLLRFVPTKQTTLSSQLILNLDQFDHIIFISQNAVLFGLSEMQSYWPQWPQSLRWYAVGPATAQRLMDEEIVQPIVPQTASSEGLLDLPELNSVSNSKILIVRGVGGREKLKEILVSRGATVDYLEVYKREAISYSGDYVSPADRRVVATVYSGEALERLAELIDNDLPVALIVPSPRLQTMAFNMGFDKVLLAVNQQDDSMLEALKVSLSQAD